MVKRYAVVKNEYGIHCRPSGIIAKAAQAYDGEVRVSGANGRDVDIRSVLGLMGLGFHCGDRVEIQVTGPDEATMCDRFVALFEKEYEFERQDSD